MKLPYVSTSHMVMHVNVLTGETVSHNGGLGPRKKTVITDELYSKLSVWVEVPQNDHFRNFNDRF